MPREIQDHWFKEAKRLGYRSRAAFKLAEIDDKRRLLKKGARVLDLGSAPGSWLQVASERIGRKGLVVGIDLLEIPTGLEATTIRIIQGDATKMIGDTLAAIGVDPAIPFDVLLSDMAPATTGNRDTDHFGSMRLCDTVLELAARWLRPGGSLVMKAFEGSSSPDLLARLKSMFAATRSAKPKASRRDSREMFLIGLDRAEHLDPTQGTDQTALDGPPPVPSGWGA